MNKSSILFIRNAISDIGDELTDRGDWLSHISDDTLISEINLPGTHDTAAISTRFNPYACHRFSVTDQLRGGIRLMDVRLKVKKSEEGRYEFTTCHGNLGSGIGLNEFQSFPSLLQEFRSFLEAHGTETVLNKGLPDSGATEEKRTEVISTFTPAEFSARVRLAAQQNGVWHGTRIFGHSDAVAGPVPPPGDIRWFEIFA
ncbi:hypothetical protein [Alcanivorax xiamenensis]|nr:hypothetical protein [Alcanivorax xiamenensis]